MACLGLAAAALLAAAGVAAAWAGSPARGHSQLDFVPHGSVEQVYVTGAQGGHRLKLVDRKGKVVDTRSVGSLGGVVFRHVEPGNGYRVRQANGAESPKLKVLTGRPAPSDTRIYDQDL